MVEKKTLYRAQENYDSATQELERYKGYGWVLVDTKLDKSENNKVEAFFLERDLDNPKNQEFKAIQDDEDEVKRARIFCSNNVYYCGNKINTYKERKRMIGVLAIILILYSLASIAFGVLFIVYPEFTQLLHMELQPSEYIITKDGIPYLILPEGIKMFGRTELNIYLLLASVIILIGVLILLIVYLIVAARVRTKKIARARIKYFERLQADYGTLDQQLAKWTKEKSKRGFDPYQGVNFNNL